MSSSTPNVLERMKIAKAKAMEARLASEQKQASGRQEAAVSFRSPPVSGDDASKRQKTSQSSGGSDGASPVEVVTTSANASGSAVAASLSSSSVSEADFIFKPADDLVVKLMDSRTKQGNHSAILVLLEQLGAADWPLNDPPDKNLCVAYLLQLRGVAQVSWSDSEKKFSVSAYSPSELNPATPWLQPEVEAEPEVDPADSEPEDLNASGGASSNTPALG